MKCFLFLFALAAFSTVANAQDLYKRSTHEVCKCTDNNNTLSGHYVEWRCDGTIEPKNACFWGGSQVTMAGGRKAFIGELRSGDLVETLGIEPITKYHPRACPRKCILAV